MIVDALTDSVGATIETDICIVGGGTAGIVLAREFIGQDVRVCLLESGGRKPEPKTQALAIGENIGQPYFPLDSARPRVLGGSGTRWDIPIGQDRIGVRVRPLDPIDFEKRDWVPYSGWPFAKSHLDPFYERAQEICQVAPASYDVSDWQEGGRYPELRGLGPDVQTVLYKFSRSDIFVRQYPDEVAQANNITVCLHSNVVDIETNSTADCVTGLRIRTLAGKTFTVRAKTYVLAAGGIVIPRLLLLSNQKQKNGLGNGHDLVGRFFMEHPHFWSGIFIPDRPNFFQSNPLYNSIHTVNGVATLGKLALTEATIRREHLLNQNVQFCWHKVIDPTKYPLVSAAGIVALKELVSDIRSGKNRDASAIVRRLKTVMKDSSEIGASVYRNIRKKLFGLPRIWTPVFANMMEQVPNPESRVTLGPERDELGLNRVQLNWKITKQDIRSAIRTQEIIAGALERAGLGRFFQELRDETPPRNTEGGYHHMGTTRMHSEPKQGVVDADSRVHGIGNLFIAGPSVFPTGGYANPVLTIVALTVRLSDHLKKQFGMVERAARPSRHLTGVIRQ
jgi:choline dehydrogenase-like flavoprotein